jgi:hypothetical protein
LNFPGTISDGPFSGKRTIPETHWDYEGKCVCKCWIGLELLICYHYSVAVLAEGNYNFFANVVFDMKPEKSIS